MARMLRSMHGRRGSASFFSGILHGVTAVLSFFLLPCVMAGWLYIGRRQG